MNKPVSVIPAPTLRQRLTDDMAMRRFSTATQRNYIRDVARFATFLGRPPDTASPDDVRRFQVEQQDAGVPVPTMNSIVSALRFFFTHARPPRSRAQARARVRATQAAGGTEPRRGRAAAERHHLPQASGSAVGRLWRRACASSRCRR